MDTNWAHDSLQRLRNVGNRRALMAKTLVGTATALLPAALLVDPASAFNSLSGCKKRCKKKFDGTCRSRCANCCQKVFNRGKSSCDFGCGKIRRK